MQYELTPAQRALQAKARELARSQMGAKEKAAREVYVDDKGRVRGILFRMKTEKSGTKTPVFQIGIMSTLESKIVNTTVSINLHGAPALTLEKLPSYHQDTIVGFSLQVTAPLGQYDETRIVNIGTNRWILRTELGVSKALGDWTFEIAPSAAFFSVNDDFYGGHRRAQDPVYAVQGSAIYGLRRGRWVALSGTWYTGGRTSIDDGPSKNLQRNSLLMATFGFPVDRRNSIKLYASTGLVTRIGSDADTFGVAWQHRWGGGL